MTATSDAFTFAAGDGRLDSSDHIGMAGRLARTVADGREVTVDGTVHYPNMERPDAFNEILGDFLRAVPA
ncbi:alpha/beta fold hydrolase [Streptosporangium pseudovulgare]|nr:hypothetical protein [Streptosporangium pseudovulgare]